MEERRNGGMEEQRNGGILHARHRMGKVGLVAHPVVVV